MPNEIAILIVESEPDVAERLKKELEYLGFACHIEVDGRSGVNAALSRQWDLIIVNQFLPGLGGLELCREVRAVETGAAIIMLSCSYSEIDKVLALEIGVDEFIAIPFSPVELRARIRSLLRRLTFTERPEDVEMLRFETLLLNNRAREVTVDGHPVELTSTEFDLLKLLLLSSGKVLSRTELLHKVWGHELHCYEYNITTHISRLRVKLKRVSNYSDCIKTIRGVGYLFNENALHAGHGRMKVQNYS